MFATFKQYCRRWEAYKDNLKLTSKLKYVVVDTAEVVIVALAMALAIRQFVIQTSVIPSPSMVPTLKVGDRLFLNKFIYRFSSPNRGDIVVFKSPFKDGKDYVKRCIGLPGENVRVIEGEVYINGKLLLLPGVDFQNDLSNFGPVDVPADSYFVMGDNRGNSLDSRFWGFVPRKEVLGQALFTFWPISRMRHLK